ncbi:hypothetical protein [Microbacterium sp. Leaf320]|uniref:hypothetical protein n=1 Tax=Microbacterium sp. Leaf320 TaxID=1736334 RepID=UPI0006F2B502|nr:hypothetical protein [Microbacterium sp. Leaf320]KQQ65204.1 hypothetical protein ASF63_14700 [Microbacterium sp. Leaf320]
MGAREVETSSYIEFARRIIRRAGERVAEADDWELAELVSLVDDVDRAVRRAVAGQREAGRSWQYIGDALGIKRQSAQERYGKDAG